jgi:F-type H+-transporting ATPase subunit alpha
MPATPASKEVGFITAIQDYLMYLEGLPSVSVNDILVCENGARALVTALEREKVEAVMLDRFRPKPGDSLSLLPGGLRMPIGDAMLGRAINPIGEALDDKPPLPPGGEKIDLDRVAGGIDTRRIITEQFATGISMIDTLLPIGKGQRELIIGEPRGGKSSFLLECINHQKNTDIICIYAGIGKPEVETRRFIKSMTETNSFEHLIVVAASSQESAPLIYITPHIALSIAEYFAMKGRDILLILDDLSVHAKYLREMSLLSGRIPGRESYPADIFYQHSHLVERAGSFNDRGGKGSITLLPTVETELENLTAFIPTNIMSMTDGHIFFSASLRAQGLYPAVEPERSVTRVGHQTQAILHKQLSDKLRTLLADFHELEKYGHFGSELSGGTQVTLNRGKVLVEMLTQEPLQNIPIPTQICLLGLIFTPFCEKHDAEFIHRFKPTILKLIEEAPEFKVVKDKLPTLKLEDLFAELSKLHDFLEGKCQIS